jgi:hypothetical protein
MQMEHNLLTQLTQQQMAQYERDGYIALPHFFVGREVQAMALSK